MTGGAEPQGAAATGTGTAASTNNSPYEASWEPELAQQIADMVKVKEDASNISSSSSCRKYPYCMVGLCGIPGSGKSVSSLLLANALETLGLECMIMPHDGYHYPLETLQTFPHAEDAIYRRGAPDTFDAQALLRDLQRIRPLIQEEEQQPQQQEDKKDNNVDLGNPQEQQDKDDEKDDNMEQWIRLPGFDHGKGDPEPGVHIFDRQKHQVVICEECIRRLKIRNLVIPGYTPQEIERRCDVVDRANALTVMASSQYANVIVQSRTSSSPAMTTRTTTTRTTTTT